MRKAVHGLVGLLLAGLAIAGCGYRFRAAPTLGESVRVVVDVDDARLVRSQLSLQSAVATALQRRLGWEVSPLGSAQLRLTMREERIRSVAIDARDIPARWSITLTGSAALISKHGLITHSYRGTGYATSIDDEATALQQAADNCAAWIEVWLERAGKYWH